MYWVTRTARETALLVVTSAMAISCSASGDQILGRVVADNATPIVLSEAGTSSGDASSGDCDSTEIEAKPMQVDLYALIDRSQSMQDPDNDKWEVLVTSFTRFLQSGVANGTWLGAGYFPMGPDECRSDPRPCQGRGVICNPDMYLNARVEISKLPDNYQGLVTSIFQQPTGAPTVTRPALQGSLMHASNWERSHPGRRVVEILITGGPPSADACGPNNVADCVSTVSLFSSKTYVIAFGTDRAALDPIASAGGGEAFSVDVRDPMPDRLGEIIKQIHDEETDCEWAIPPTAPGFDYGKLNIKVTGLFNDMPLVPSVLTKVKNRQACTANDLEWYYDNGSAASTMGTPGGTHPTRIIACSATCKRIHQSTAPTSAKISLGCQSITAAPTK